MKRYEYKTELLDSKIIKSLSTVAESLDELTARYGYHGWRLVQITPVTASGSTSKLFVTFEMEKEVFEKSASISPVAE